MKANKMNWTELPVVIGEKDSSENNIMTHYDRNENISHIFKVPRKGFT